MWQCLLVNYVVVNFRERHNWFTKQMVATIFEVVVTVSVAVVEARLIELLKNGCRDSTKLSLVANTKLDSTVARPTLHSLFGFRLIQTFFHSRLARWTGILQHISLWPSSLRLMKPQTSLWDPVISSHRVVQLRLSSKNLSVYNNTRFLSSSSLLHSTAGGRLLHQFSISLYPALSVVKQFLLEFSWLFCMPTCCRASLLGGLPISTSLIWSS